MVTLELTFIGLVQGVGFRMTALSEAQKLGVKGWVRNSHKEDIVEAVFQGEENKVNSLIECLKSNPGAIRVKQVIVNELHINEKFDSFEIKY